MLITSVLTSCRSRLGPDCTAADICTAVGSARENNADFVCSTVQVSLLVGLKMISVKGPLTDQDAAVAA